MSVMRSPKLSKPTVAFGYRVGAGAGESSVPEEREKNALEKKAAVATKVVANSKEPEEENVAIVRDVLARARDRDRDRKIVAVQVKEEEEEEEEKLQQQQQHKQQQQQQDDPFDDIYYKDRADEDYEYAERSAADDDYEYAEER